MIPMMTPILFGTVASAARDAWRPAAILLLASALAGCDGAGEARHADPALGASPGGSLSEAEVAQGWRPLFDGQTLDGWRGLGRDSIPTAHWTVENGTIRKIASGDVPTAPDGQPLEGGDLMTRETFQDFDLHFEWRVSPGGNSGIKYNVSEEMSTASPPGYAALGFEYQILDDDLHPDAEVPSHRAGALYDILPANDQKRLQPVGEWNESRLVFHGNRGEHWLNGELIVEFELGSPEMDSLVAASKYDVVPGFADRRRGHIVLQDHGDDVWFRNIRIRELE
jgi:hypothetical protein